MKVCEAIILSDIDWFNITSLFTKLVRLIIQKRDQTTIDLGSNSLKASAITDKFLGGDHRLKKSYTQNDPLEILSQCDAYYLEHNCLLGVLKVMKTLTASKVF